MNKNKKDEKGQRYLNQAAAARYFGVSEAILRSWDCPRIFIGSSRFKNVRGIRYDIEKVAAWIEENLSERKQERMKRRRKVAEVPCCGCDNAERGVEGDKTGEEGARDSAEVLSAGENEEMAGSGRDAVLRRL